MKRRNFLKKASIGIGGVTLFSSSIVVSSCLSGTASNKVKSIEKDGMVLIEGGNFWKGTKKEDAVAIAKKYGYDFSWIASEVREEESSEPSYWIDKYPVTNSEYLAFCEATEYKTPLDWEEGKPPQSKMNHPVTMVNRDDAMAYAKWAGKSLPTEAQWEKAARGTDGQQFPWGNEFKDNACNWNHPEIVKETTEVDAFPNGVSPYGVWDMCGNVFEWCADGPGVGEFLSSAYLKGGAWISTSAFELRAAARGHAGFVNNVSEFYGFRCIKNINK